MKSIVRALIVALLTAFIALPTVSPATAAGRAATTSSVTVSAASVVPGQTVSVSGTLKRGTAPFVGVTFALQQRAVGTAAWSGLRTATTNHLGQVTATVRPTKKYEYRAVFAGNASAYPSASLARVVTMREAATITKTSSAAVDAGDTITVSGTTTAALTGRTATLQLKAGTAWKNVASARVSSTRTFSVSTKASGRGNQYYRVQVAGTPGATSSTKTFTVYAWYALEKVVPYYWHALVPQTNWRVAGKTYPVVLGAFDVQNSDRAFTLGGQCRTFKGAIGLMDRSTERTEFYVGIRKGAAEFGTMSPGQAPRQVSANLTGSDFISLATLGNQNYNRGSFPSWIGARISCTTEPGYFTY